MVGVRSSKGSALVGVYASEDVPLHAIHEAHHRVGLKHSVALGPPELLSWLVYVLDESAGASRDGECGVFGYPALCLQVTEDSTHSGDRTCVSFGLEYAVDFLLAQAWMLGAQGDDTACEYFGCVASAPSLRCSVTWI